MNIKRILLASVVLAVMASVASAQSLDRPGGVQTDPPKRLAGLQAESLVGSWIATVTPTGPGAPPPFKVLLNFTEDGGFTGSAQGDICQEGVATPGYGAWSPAGGRRFDMTFLQIIYQPKDPVGIPLGTFKVRQTINLSESGNEWSGPFKGDIFDPTGNLVFASQGTATAKRIVVERLP